MRLGKEQAAGYVEDTEAGEPAEDINTGQPQRLTPVTVTEPALPVA